MSDTQDGGQVLSPSDSIKNKIAAAKPDIITAGGSGHTDSFIVKVLNLLVDIIPDVLELFSGSKASSGVGSGDPASASSADPGA